MNEWWHRRAVLALVLVAIMLAPFAQLGRVAGAQPATPVPGAQTWQVLVDNVSPEGENWSFNTLYPDHLQAHPGDTIVFTLAPNPSAFHTVMVLAQALTPLEMYAGFAGGFVLPDPSRPGELQSTFFSSERGGEPEQPPCGRPHQDSCPIAHSEDVDFGLNSGVLVNPPPGGGEGNTSFTVTLDPELPLGPYYVMSLVDGPTMSGRIDVVAADQPVQSADALQAAAQRQYGADLAWLAHEDRVSGPAEESRPDGTKIWSADAGGGDQDPRLSINEFSPAQMVIVAGDTVTWTNHSPSVVAHTVSGFVTTAGGELPNLSPYQPVCLTSSGEVQLPPTGSFPPDIWNTCPGAEANQLTALSQPSAPSGDPYVDGTRTSGILLNQEYLDSPIGDGLPFASSYSVTFPNPGTYHYACAIHPGMVGTVVVVPQPMPR